jgi:hypothetical protein
MSMVDIQQEQFEFLERRDHRYQKKKIDCLRFGMCQLLVPHNPRGFFTAAIYSTNETNIAGGTCHKQSISLYVYERDTNTRVSIIPR